MIVADCFGVCQLYTSWIQVLADRESGADYRERVAQRYPPTGVSVSSVMAKSKSKNAPKGIDDQIIGGVRAIMSPWLGAPPAQNKSVTQAQGLARGAAQTLDQTFAGGMIGAGVKGNKALAKQAGVNAVALGAGYVASKAVGAVAGIVRNSSEVYYGVHGSPISNLSKITPQMGRNTQGFNKNVTGMFGKDSAIASPKVFSYKAEPTNVAATTQYAQDAGRGTGSVYLVKTKAKNVSSNIVDTSKAASFTDSFAAQSLSREQMSNKAMKVVKEFPISNYTKKTFNVMDDGWDTTQDFAPLARQIKDAIQSNKKFNFANLAKLPKKR